MQFFSPQRPLAAILNPKWPPKWIKYGESPRYFTGNSKMSHHFLTWNLKLNNIWSAVSEAIFQISFLKHILYLFTFSGWKKCIFFISEAPYNFFESLIRKSGSDTALQIFFWTFWYLKHHGSLKNGREKCRALRRDFGNFFV